MTKPDKRRGRSSPIAGSKGFALVVTVSLLVLLSVVALGMLSLSAVSLRSSSQESAAMEARANARLALMIAIGELQEAMGPDQRISAKAEVLDEVPATEVIDGVANPHYLGVWDSWNTWLTDTKGPLSIQDTYKRGRDPSLFRAWLVSHPDSSKYETAISTAPTVDWVEMCGKNSAGPDVANHVKVPRMPIKSGSRVTGNYAWWVSDESMKVRLDLKAREAASTLSAAQLASAQTGRTGIEKMSAMSTFDASPESLTKMITTQQAGLSAPGISEHFHNITAYSLGLLTDVRSGGFKSDLNLAFESDDLPEQMENKTLFGHTFEAPIRPMTGTLAGITPQNIHVGPMSWRQLREFYRTYRSGFADSGMKQPLTWNAGQPETNRLLIGKEKLNQWDTMGYARQPVMLRQTWVIATSSLTNAALPGGIDYYLLAIPVITLWNPYNVTLKMESTEVGYSGAIYWSMNLRQLIYRNGALVSQTDLPDETRRPTYYGNNNNPNGDITANQVGFQMKISESGSAPIVFKPGEVRIFSTDGQITNAVAPGQNTRFFLASPGYKPVEDTSAGVLRGLKYRIYPGVGPGVPELALGFVRNPLRDTIAPLPDMRSPPGSAISLVAGQRSAPIIWTFQDGYKNNGKTLVENGSTVNKAYLVSNPYNEDYWDMSWTGFTALNWIDQADVESNGWLIPDSAASRARWPSPGQPPLPVAMVSIVAKSPQRLSYEASGDFTKDFRNRGWLHAPATRMSNFTLDATDLTRAESAYQLHFLPVNGDLEISQYLEADGPLAYYGGGYSANNGQTHVTALSVPTSPVMNLGSFAGIRMDRGQSRGDVPDNGRPIWYSYSRNKVKSHTAGAFGVGIGNGYAHPMISPAGVYTRNNMGRDSKATYFQRPAPWFGTGLNLCDDYWDHLFLANEELWDSWFCSGFAPVVNNGSVITSKKSVALNFFSNQPASLSPHFEPYKRNKTTQELADLVETTTAPDDENGWDLIGSHLLNKGQFNVNSTSKQAWKALLLSLARRPIALYDPVSGTSVISADANDVTLSRHPLANGASAASGPGDESAWRGIRKLTEPQIDKLAEEIVRQVKLRGPFLNMTEFINRRLSTDDTGVVGALQAAIDWDEFNAGYDGSTSGLGESINKDYKGSSDMISSPPANYPNPKAATGSRYAGIPGYVMQSDILQGLSSSLSVRGDTFVIRTYGESLTPDGKVAANAWCEAVVQRMPEYVDPTDAADKKMRIAGNLPGVTATLSPLNQTYGRQFRISSFRWLSKDEI